jgi:hypothetical protein
MNKETKFYIFGSKSSLDTDVMVILDKIGSIQDNKMTTLRAVNYLSQNYDFDKDLNINLATIKNGVIDSVHKGTPDEVNNSLLVTYKNHKQYFKLDIKKKVKRDIQTKTIRCLRIMLSFLSKTGSRNVIKKALLGDGFDKAELLKSIDISVITDLNKQSVSFLDYVKSMAFQMGQTLALNNGEELYSKESIAKKYPELKPYLDRDYESLDALEDFKNKFLNSLDIESLKDVFEEKKE